MSYRPICCLPSHAYKGFAIIVLGRIRDSIDSRIKEGQEGFQNGRGCRDKLFVLRAAINYALKKKINAEIVFIDFTQAFDTVSHEFLQIALRDHGIPEKFCKLIEVIYSNAIGRTVAAIYTITDNSPISAIGSRFPVSSHFEFFARTVWPRKSLKFAQSAAQARFLL